MGDGVAVRHDLRGVFVAQRIEIEMAEFGDADAFSEELGRIDRREAHAAPQVTLRIRVQRIACARHRRADAAPGATDDGQEW